MPYSPDPQIQILFDQQMQSLNVLKEIDRLLNTPFMKRHCKRTTQDLITEWIAASEGYKNIAVELKMLDAQMIRSTRAIDTTVGDYMRLKVA